MPIPKRECIAEAQLALAEGRFEHALQLLDAVNSESLASIAQWHIAKGVALYASGDMVAAEAAFRTSLDESLKSALVSWKNLAGVLATQQRFSEAEPCIENYRTWHPREQEALLMHSSILVKQDKLEKAHAILDDYLECFPDDHEVSIARIDVMHQERAYLPALFQSAQLAADCADNDTTAVALQINLCSLLGLNAAAGALIEDYFGATGAMTPALADVIGSHCLRNGLYEEAVTVLGPYIDVPDTPTTLPFNLAWGLLALGRYEDGWRLYAKRKNNLPMSSLGNIKFWEGEPLGGKRVLIHWEQGLGDSLFFMRYIPILETMGTQMVFNAQKPIVDLLKLSEGIDTKANLRTDAASFDYQLHLGDLPLACGTRTVSDIPCTVPYVKPPQDKVAEWRTRLSLLPGKLVGLAWAGFSGHGNDHRRSMSLADLTPLSAVPGITFVSLQIGESAGEVDQYAEELPLYDLQKEISDLSDTAAVIANLDLVIAVDTAVAHLAGAMGMPVWILLPDHGTDFRWQIHRDDSPWYPTARLFRQDHRSTWHDLIVDMRTRLWTWAMEGRQHIPGSWEIASRFLTQTDLVEPETCETWVGILSDEDISWALSAAQSVAQKLGSATILEKLALHFSDAPQATSELAIFLGNNSRFDEARPLWASLEQRSALRTRDWIHWSSALRTRGQVEEAKSIAERGLKQKPDDPRLLMQLGRCLSDQGLRQVAIDTFRRVIDLSPRPIETNYLLGIEYLKERQSKFAVDCFQKTLLMNPQHWGTRMAIAGIASHMDLPDLAIQILSTDDETARPLEATLDLATSFAIRGNHLQAEQIIADIPINALGEREQMAYVRTLFALDKTQEHELNLTRAFKTATSEAEATLVYALHNLKKGNYTSGWPAYRLAIKGRKTSIPLWSGEELSDKNLLVYQDQGVGDFLQFLPLVRELAPLTRKLYLAAGSSLLPLVDYQDLKVKTLTLDGIKWEGDDRFDYQVPQMHLPALLGCDLCHPYHATPYLAAPRALLTQWEVQFSEDERPKIGIAWAGNPQYTNDGLRSSRLSAWRSLAELPRIVWCNLQKDVASNQAYSVPDFKFRNLAADCDNWLKTASIVQQLDLVITVDTALAHLAGAMNVPVWILLPERGVDFRWQNERIDCPWYPSATLFRKKAGERWVEVIERVKTALIAYLDALPRDCQ